MFTTALELLELAQPDLWAIDAPLVYASLSGEAITVPKGFITDLASIPHWLDGLPFLDRTGASRRPGAMHDWLYAGMRARGKDWCDGMLREALEAEGLSYGQASIYYKAVQWFGAKPWAADGNRHPYDVNSANLETCDFINEASWQAWIATNPVPNQNNAKHF